MSRKAIEERFLEILDGSLPPDEEARLRARISADPELSRAFDAYRFVMDVEQRAARVSHKAPSDLAAKVEERLPDRRTVLEYLGELMASRRFAGSAATLAVLVLVVKLAWESPESRRGSAVFTESRLEARETPALRETAKPISRVELPPAAGDAIGPQKRASASDGAKPVGAEPPARRADAPERHLGARAVGGRTAAGTGTTDSPESDELAPLFEERVKQREDRETMREAAPAASLLENSAAAPRRSKEASLSRRAEGEAAIAPESSSLLDKALTAPASAPDLVAGLGTFEEAANRFNRLAGEAPVTFEAVAAPLRPGRHLAVFSVAAHDAAEIVVRPVRDRIRAYSILGQAAGGATSSATRIRARDGRATILIELALSRGDSNQPILAIEARAGLGDRGSQQYRVEIEPADIAPGMGATSEFFRAVIAAVHALRKERDPSREPYDYADILEALGPVPSDGAAAELSAELEGLSREP